MPQYINPYFNCPSRRSLSLVFQSVRYVHCNTMLHFTEDISLHPHWLRRTRLIRRKQLPLSRFSQVLYLIYGKVTMIYQRAPSLNSSPVHPVDSSLLECELKAGIRFAPDLMQKRLRRWTTGCLVGRVAEQSAAKYFAPKLQRGLEVARHLYVQASHL